MQQKINVLVTLSFEQPLLDKLSRVSPNLEIVQHEARSVDDIAEIMEEVEILYTLEAIPLAENAPNLRWVQLHSAGADSILQHPLYAQSDVLFTTANGIHAIPMAEYVIAQILAFSHHLPEMFEDKANAAWPKGRWKRYVPSEIHGSTLGIIGYGSIGRHVARLAQGLGMKVLAVKRDVRILADERYAKPGIGDPEGELPDRIYPPQALHSFLKECDYVVLTVPLTSHTQHLIDAAALSAMKPNAVLINIARGGVVDEQALQDALIQETIGGAALDVFSEEPLPGSSPLWQLPNVIISPHISGFTPHYDERASDIFAENLRRYIAGEPLLNVVDRDRDY
ncbi:MAG: D-2-hydroxyacid dehydrogenase [Anaerolineae bacterium]|nr:D-2-hydroxyacid dehydrogenase [Anaerolineae bacterium]